MTEQILAWHFVSDTLRYGIAWADGDFTGPITDEYRLAQAYARTFGGKVYDSHDKTDAEYLRYCALFGEEP